MSDLDLSYDPNWKPSGDGGSDIDLSYDPNWKPKKKNQGAMSDLGTDLKIGAQQLPGAIAGIADIPVALLTGERHVSKLADKAGEITGFQPGKWAEQNEAEYSDERRQAQQNVEDAWKDGDAGDIAGAYLKNPVHNIGGLVARSLPGMVAGGAVGRAVAGAAKALSPVAGAAIGEGAIAAGSAMDETPEEVDARRAAVAALGTGVGTAALGQAGGKLAQKAGLVDPDVLVAGGKVAADAPARGLAGRMFGGALAEGAFEELPQSVQETMWANWAQEKDLFENVPRAAVEGVLAGGVMGAGFNVLPAGREAAATDTTGGEAEGDSKQSPPLALPAPTYTGTPSNQVLEAEAQRANEVAQAQARADAIYAARAEFEAAQQKGEPAPFVLVTNPDPIQQRIDRLLGIGEKPMTDTERASYERTLSRAFNEQVGITQDKDGREIPLTMADYLNSQVNAEDAARWRPYRDQATQAAQARLSQVEQEEVSQQPDIPVVGPLSAAANMAVRTGAARVGGGGGGGSITAAARVSSGGLPDGRANQGSGGSTGAVGAGGGMPVAGVSGVLRAGNGVAGGGASADVAGAAVGVPGQSGAALKGVARATQSQQVAQEAAQANGQEAGAQQGAAPAGEVADSSLNRDSSWVIRNKETGEVVMETYDKAKVDALNTAKYEAVPVQEYLGSINGAKNPQSAEQPAGEVTQPAPNRTGIEQDLEAGAQQAATPGPSLNDRWNSMTTPERQAMAVRAGFVTKDGRPNVAAVGLSKRGLDAAPPEVRQKLQAVFEADEALMAEKPAKRVKPVAEQDKPLQARATRYSDDLLSMAQDAGWAETGGRLLRDADGNPNGRTAWVPRAPWFRSGMEGDAAKLAQHVADFLAGNAIPAKSRRTIEGMLEWREAQESVTDVSPDASMYDLERAGYAGVEGEDAGLIDAFDEVAGKVLTEAEAMRALGFTEEEINEATSGREGQGNLGPEAQDGNPVAGAAGEGQEGNLQSGEAPVRTEGQAEGLTLESYTNEEIVAREEAARQQEKERKEEEARSEKEAKDRETKAEVKRRSEAAASTFQLGQDGMDNLTGQGGLFDGANQNPIKSETPADAGAKTESAGADKNAAKKDDPLVSEMEALKSEMGQAIGELASILGAKTNLTPEEESRIIPVMSKIFRIAAKMGYIKFKEAAGYVMQQIRAMAGNDIADKLSIENLQAGYINIAKEIGGDKREAMAYDSIEELEKENVTDERSGADLERDRTDAETEDGVGQESVQPGWDGDGRTGKRGVEGAEVEARQRGGERGSVDEAVPSGERSDQQIYTGSPEPGPGSAGSNVDLGSRDSGVAGLPVEPRAADRIADVATSDIQKQQAKLDQRRADNSASTAPGIDSVRNALPVLTPGQQEDVVKAEARFAVDDGYGMLFTNGTGTGKTFTGLGVIKRFANAGKTNILVVAPNDKIIEDWQKSGKMLGLDISRLTNTNDAGQGIVITTYANLGSNDALARRDWDLVVSDEAHYLTMDKDGKPTTFINNMRAITLHPDGLYQRHSMLHREEIDRLKELSEEAKRQRMSDDERDWTRADATQAKADKLVAELKAKQDAIKADIEARQGASRTRALFLSATPFAYEKTVDWANGYLFDYNEGRGDESREFRGYNQGSNKDQFFMQHFGYRMRTGKLTEPDAKVDRGLMQRQFNSWLKKRGALSGRMLDVAADYDRRFILVDSGIGKRIDDALEWFEQSRKAHQSQFDDSEVGQRIAGIMGKTDPYVTALSAVRDHIGEKFDYLSRRYLLESIKAKEVVPHIREHLAMGRKVVVFHDYKKGGGFNPFILEHRKGGETEEQKAEVEAWNRVVDAFNREFSDIIHSDLFRQSSPIEMFRKEFPDVLLFNGDIPAKQRRANVAKFQDDASGPQVILVQSAAGKEGISLHDTTGKHQRVLFNLGQPTQPTTAIQQEGRIYRTGQVTDAIFRYLNTGTRWEQWAFATTIAQRASAAENLGMGEMARALKDAFITGFEESGDYRAGMEGEGKGGKERDRMANEAISEYDRAKSFYFGQQKKTSATKAAEGADYFATPEPVGLKMVEFADIRPGESVLEPSAGHGAIARWVPDNAERTAIEPSMKLRPRLAMVFNGDIIGTDFESHNTINKYDAVVMNPPFGAGGKTAIEHLDKAAKHLRDGGRIVALIPTGPAADKRFEKWMYGTEERDVKPLMDHPTLGPIYRGDTIATRASWMPEGVVVRRDKEGRLWLKREGVSGESMVSPEAFVSAKATGPRKAEYRPADGLYMRMDIKLPSVTFERAGTQVATRIVVIDKVLDKEAAPQNQSVFNQDITGITDIGELFDRIENMAVPQRAKPVEAEAESPASNRSNAKKQKDAARQEAMKAEEAAQEAGAIVPQNEATFEVKGDKLITNAPLREYTTKAGKLLKGVWVPDQATAKAVDKFTWKSRDFDGNYFVRIEHVKRPGVGQDGVGNIASTNRISSADKAIYGMAAEGKSAKEILQFIAEASRSPFNRQVAKLLLKTGIAPTITVGDGKGWKMNAGEGNKYAAGFDPKKNMVALFRVASAERNMLHELVHAATLQALGKKGLASVQMKRLFDHVKKTGKLKGMYGMADIDEFVAEAFTNPHFQQKLKGVGAPRHAGTLKSAWHWFVRVVRGILGIKANEENALSRALELGVEVMRENMRLSNESEDGNVRGMADKDTVAGTQAPTSAGDGSKAGADVVAEQTTDWAKVGKVFVGDGGRVTVYFMKGFQPGKNEKRSVENSVMDAFRPKLPDGQYWRFTNNKNELNLIKSGELLRSKNHADNSDEIGLSVAEGAHYGIQGYKFGYIVSGDVIGRGSDGEPLLDVGKLRPVTKLMPVDEIVSKDRAERAALMKARGWTHEQIADIANGTFKIVTKPNEPSASAGSDADIRYNVADDAWGVAEPSKMDDVIYSLQDKHIDLKRVIEGIRATGKKIADAVNPYLQEELFHGRAAKGVKNFLDMELRPLLAQMQSMKIDMGDFEEYLWNRHAEERNQQIAKINPDMPDGGSGIKTADARAYLAGLSAERRGQFEKLAARVDAMNRESQKVLVESGLEKQETIDAWNGAYQHYVPLQREDVDSGHVGTGKGFSIRGSSTKRAMGSGRQVVDIIANLTMQRERNIVRAEKNRVSQALMGLALENPNPDFWEVDKAPKERAVVEKAIYSVMDKDGKKIEEHTVFADAEKAVRQNPGSHIEQTWGDRVEERVVPGFSTRDNVVLTRINGEDHYIILNERDERAMRMAASLKNMDVDNMGRALSVVGKATRYLASVNTQYNPVFGVINLIRDVQGAMLNLSSTPLAGEQKKVTGYTVDALRGIYADIRAHRAGKQPSSNWAKLFEEFQREGGQTGYRDQYANAEQRAEAIRDELAQFKEGTPKKMVRALFGWLSDYNETMENAVRLAAYKAGLEKGMTKQQAASLAKNLTVNFNRKGQATTQIGALYAFFNASVQGSARMFQTLFEMQYGNIKTLRLSKTGKKIVYGGILLGSMQAMLLAAAGFDDDEPPEFIRERNLILPIGDGKYLTLAMPLGFHVIPGIGRIATEFAMSGFKDPSKRMFDFLGMFMDSFNPVGNAGFSLQTITPSVVDPFAALAENRDFTGKEIARENMNGRDPTPGHMRAKDTATYWAKLISEGLNFITGGTEFKPGMLSPTPDQIDYLIGQATGGVGREGSKLFQSAGAGMTGEDLPLHKIPLVGRFVGDTEGQSGESAKFYAAIKRINGHGREYEGLMEKYGREEAMQYIEENPEAKLWMGANRVERIVQKLRKQKRELLNGDAGPDQIREIDARITSVMQDFNKRVEEMAE